MKTRFDFKIVLPLAYLCIVSFLALHGLIPKSLSWWIFGVNAITAIFYVNDKTMSRIKNASRTPERNLHLMGILGGWPAALLAIQILRHKSSKPDYIFTVWATAVANIGILFMAIDKAS